MSQALATASGVVSPARGKFCPQDESLPIDPYQGGYVFVKNMIHISGWYKINHQWFTSPKPFVTEGDIIVPDGYVSPSLLVFEAYEQLDPWIWWVRGKEVVLEGAPTL